MSDERSTAPINDYELACNVSAAITSTLVLEDALESVARRIAEALDVWECDLFEYYAESRTIVATAMWAPVVAEEDLRWVGTRATLDERPTYAPVLVDGAITTDYVDDADVEPSDRDLMAAWGELSTMSVPLRFEDDIIGCLTLVEKRELRRFSDHDRQLATLLATPAAIAVHNARVYHRQMEQNRQLTSLLDSSRALTSTLVLEDVLSLVGRQAAQALAVQECVIFEFDAVQDALVFRSLYQTVPDADSEGQIGEVFPMDEQPSDRELLRTGEPRQETISDPELPADVRASMEKWGEKTCLNVPLVYKSEPKGILVLIETLHERHFSADELELARGLAEQAAAAVRHAQLYRRQERQNRRLVALLETSRVLAASLDPADVAAELRREAAGLFGALDTRVDICVVADDGRYYPLETALGGQGAPGGTDDEPVAPDALALAAVEEVQPQTATDAAGSRLVVPLLLDDPGDGYIDVQAPAGHTFTVDEIGLLQILSNQAGAAIVNTRLYRAIERQAITDGLTGLYNHRYFYERLGDEFARARRYEVPLSLLMVDVDDFKQFNDRYGHQLGDRILIDVGDALKGQIRQDVDLAARYGGEEFVVLLPNTPRDGAQALGDRLVKGLARPVLTDPAIPPAQAAGAVRVGERILHSIADHELPAPSGRVHVTVSIGVATFPGAADSADELVANADKALYLAKRRGKNRLEVYHA